MGQQKVCSLLVLADKANGHHAVAKHRESKGLPALEVFVIDVISATSANLDHQDVAWLKNAKLSSTFIRQWIVANGVQ